MAASLIVGALAAAGLRLPPRVAATLTAFGVGGILLELVPDAEDQAGRWLIAAGCWPARSSTSGPTPG